MQGLGIPYQNDITTCNNEDFWMKSVDLWVNFTIFPSCFKDFITIHEYTKNIIA